jgi:divalent metal cation (Fe/Co/Zn/Cd) transporter
LNKKGPLINTGRKNLAVQKWVAFVSVLLLVVKFVAYYSTHSVSILTDALESIVNVAAGFIGLYSLYIALSRETEIILTVMAKLNLFLRRLKGL